MGGPEAIRGYLFQTILAILESFMDEEWTSFKLEPDIESEKVDILWNYQHQQKMVQVKSSINQINVPHVKKWIRELNSEIPKSISKELRLIGPVSQGALDLIEFEGVIIPPPKNNDVEGMKSEAAHVLGKFCLKNEIYLYNAIAQEYVVEILISKYLLQSINGKEMKRNKFISFIRQIATEFLSDKKILKSKDIINHEHIYKELVDWTKESNDYVQSFQYEKNSDFQFFLNLKLQEEFYHGGIAVFFPNDSESYVIQQLLDFSNLYSIYCSTDDQVQKKFHLSLLEYTAEKDLVFKRRTIKEKQYYEFTKQVFFSDHSRSFFSSNLLKIKNVVQFTISKFLLLFIDSQEFINKIKQNLSKKREVLSEELKNGITKLKLKSKQDSRNFVYCFIDPLLGRIKIEGGFKVFFIPDVPELKNIEPDKRLQVFLNGMGEITEKFSVSCKINQDRHILVGHVMKVLDISRYSDYNLENAVNAVENVIFRSRFAHIKAYPIFYGQNDLN